MAKVIIKMDNRDYKAVCMEIEEWYSLKLTPAQMKKVLSKDRDLLIQVADSVIVSNDYMGLADTSVREQVINHISIWIMGESWPTGAISRKKSNKFFNKFDRAAKKASYKFDKEAYV